MTVTITPIDEPISFRQVDDDPNADGQIPRDAQHAQYQRSTPAHQHLASTP